MNKAISTGIAMVGMAAAVAVPSVIAQALGASAVAGALVLPVMAGVLPALLADVRTALFSTGAIVLGSMAATAASGDPILSAIVMATTALLTGLACRWGRSKSLIIVPISIGFIICTPPSISSDRAVEALILGAASLAAALWGTGVGWFLGRAKPKAPAQLEGWPRTLAYAIVLAILTGIAAGISVAIDWGHAGGWFILTVVVVFQPYIQDSFRRTGARALGTIVGVIAAYLIHLVVPWSTVEAIVGIVLMVVSVIVVMNPKNPYWVFTALITPAIVLLAGSSSDFESVDFARLLATLAGAGLAFVAALLLAPLYSAGAKKHGSAHY